MYVDHRSHSRHTSFKYFPLVQSVQIVSSQACRALALHALTRNPFG